MNIKVTAFTESKKFYYSDQYIWDLPQSLSSGLKRFGQAGSFPASGYVWNLLITLQKVCDSDRSGSKLFDALMVF